jgi:hypothetical protein
MIITVAALTLRFYVSDGWTLTKDEANKSLIDSLKLVHGNQYECKNKNCEICKEELK